MTDENIAIRIINDIGASNVGRGIGVSRQNVNYWKKQGIIPPRQVIKFVKFAKQNGYNITVSDLQPDML